MMTDLDGDRLIQIIHCRGHSRYRLGRFQESIADLTTVYASETPELAADSALDNCQNLPAAG